MTFSSRERGWSLVWQQGDSAASGWGGGVEGWGATAASQNRQSQSPAFLIGRLTVRRRLRQMIQNAAQMSDGPKVSFFVCFVFFLSIFFFFFMILFSSRVLDLCFVSLKRHTKISAVGGRKKTNILSPLFAVFHIKKFFF